MECEELVQVRVTEHNGKKIVEGHVRFSGSSGSWMGQRSTEGAEEFTLFDGKGNESYKLGTRFFIYERFISAIQGLEFVGGKMSYI